LIRGGSKARAFLFEYGSLANGLARIVGARAGTQWQTDRMIDYLEENGLIKGNKTKGYHKTEKGEIWHGILKKHRDLVGVLTRELSGDRRKRL